MPKRPERPLRPDRPSRFDRARRAPTPSTTQPKVAPVLAMSQPKKTAA